MLMILASPALEARADTVAVTEDLLAWSSALRSFVGALPEAGASTAAMRAEVEARFGFDPLDPAATGKAGRATFGSMKGATVGLRLGPDPGPPLSRALCPGPGDLHVLFGLPGRPLTRGVEGCASVRIRGDQLSISTRHSALATGPLRLAFHRQPEAGFLSHAGADLQGLLRLRLSAAGLGMLKVALGRDSPAAPWLEVARGEALVGLAPGGLRLFFALRPGAQSLTAPPGFGPLRREGDTLRAGSPAKGSAQGRLPADLRARASAPVLIDVRPSEAALKPLLGLLPPPQASLLRRFERVTVLLGVEEGRLWSEWRLRLRRRDAPSAGGDPAPRSAPRR